MIGSSNEYTRKNTARNPAKIGFLSIVDVFGPFWPVFGVLEARDPFKKLPGGDTLLFHRV